LPVSPFPLTFPSVASENINDGRSSQGTSGKENRNHEIGRTAKEYAFLHAVDAIGLQSFSKNKKAQTGASHIVWALALTFTLRKIKIPLVVVTELASHCHRDSA